MIKNIFYHEFTKKVISLFSGSLVANIISLVGFFIIAKLYEINILGEFYVYLSVVTIVSSIVTFGYLQTIQLLDDNELENMYISIVYLTGILLIITSPILYFYTKYTLYLILNIILNIYFQLSEQVFIRDSKIKNLNIIRIGRIVLNLIFLLISFYIFGNNVNCVIVMALLSLLTINSFIYSVYMKDQIKFSLRLDNLKILTKYKEFPQYIGPGMIFHTIAYQIPIVVAGTFFSPAIAANYNIAYKLVYTPAVLISGSISQVFRGKLSSQHRNNENIFKDFNKFIIVLLIIGVVFVLLSVLFLPLVVTLFFDEKWLASIDISLALLPLVFSLITIAPLTSILQFTKNQKEIFKLHLLSLIISIISFMIAVFYNDFLLGVTIFAFLMFLRYILIAFKLRKVRKDFNE